ncbi:DUF4870 domain-containing protein [Candidatus Saccharibacteria bacterium]|nr:DUF4870 domain-containing protein [Candidatus Saccharibacteria bacterium]
MEKTDEKSNKTKQSEIESGKGMAILSYFAILALIPYFSEKKNKYVRFHAVQGMNLLLVWVAFCLLSWIVNAIVWAIACPDAWSCLGNMLGGGLGIIGIVNLLVSLVGIGIGVIAIIGIVNAASGKEKPVPILGGIKIIKK